MSFTPYSALACRMLSVLFLLVSPLQLQASCDDSAFNTDRSSQFFKCYYQGKNKYDRAEYRAALRDFDRAISIRNDYACAFNDRGLVFLELDEKKRALADFDMALKLDPSLSYAFNNRAIIWIALADYDRAIRDCNAALAISPKDPMPLVNRGKALASMRCFRAAINDFTLALAYKPNWELAYCRRGSALLESGQVKEASVDLEKAIELTPGYPEAVEALARVKQLLQNRTPAGDLLPPIAAKKPTDSGVDR